MLIKRHLSGFTLLEMAVVLMIVGLLLGGMIPTLSAQMESRRINETRAHLSEIQQAIVGFSIVNGRLPCPADPTIATELANAGISRPTCTTAADSSGVLPWATLGVDETDAWGNRYTYRVTSDFADAIADATYGGGCAPVPAPTQSSFALCSSGNLDVLSAAAGGTNIAIDVPAVIISHGKNAAGAYTQQGEQITVSTDDDEKENSDGSADTNYVSHTPTQNFDDLVVWLSNNILLNRMVTAGKLP